MKALLLAIGAMALLGAVVVLLLIFALHGFAPDGMRLIIDGRELHFEDLTNWQAMGAGMGVLLGGAALVVAVPLVLLLGVLLPLMLVAGALLLVVAVALGAGVIGMAPLLVPLLVLVWLWRRAQRRARRTREAAQAVAAEQTRNASKTTIDL